MQAQTSRDAVTQSTPPVVPDYRDHRHQGALLRDVRDIVAMREPMRRNLRITLSYHDLTVGMADLLGRENVSWVGFAAWASRTAGRFIREEYMPKMMRAYLDKLSYLHRTVHTAQSLVTGLRRKQTAPPRSLLEATVERLSETIVNTIADGNLSVYADVAPVFAGMIERFRSASEYDPVARDEFLAELRPGPVDEGGQDLLVRAFGYYYEALFERRSKPRAELILLANNLVGYHEQSRLQEYIYRSLNAPVADLIAAMANERADAPTSGGTDRRVDSLMVRTLRPFYSWLQSEWARVATRWLMRLDLPGFTLNLGSDLPNRCEHYMFPRDLLTIDHPDLQALLTRLDYTPDTVQGSAATNWGKLEDRMNYIVDFFRTRQQDPSLFQPPFTPAQIEIIRVGGLPDGEL